MFSHTVLTVFITFMFVWFHYKNIYPLPLYVTSFVNVPFLYSRYLFSIFCVLQTLDSKNWSSVEKTVMSKTFVKLTVNEGKEHLAWHLNRFLLTHVYFCLLFQWECFMLCTFYNLNFVLKFRFSKESSVNDLITYWTIIYPPIVTVFSSKALVMSSWNHWPLPLKAMTS